MWKYHPVREGKFHTLEDAQVESLLGRFADRMADSFRSILRSGGLQLDDPQPVVLARLEQRGRADFPDDELLTSRVLDELVETYDPDVRVAPVIAGFARGARLAGPAHLAGQYLPPLGQIRGTDWHVDRDDLNLYGMVRQIIDEEGSGRYDRMIADGFVQRSVQLRIGARETGGKAQLMHFALLGGEHPGIPNLPPLRALGGEAVARAAREWRSFGFKPAVLGEIASRSYAILDDMKEETDTMTPEELKQLSEGIGTAVRDAISGQVAELNRALDANAKTTSVAIGEALKPIVERVAAVEAKATDDGKTAEAARATAEAAATAQREAEGKALRSRRLALADRLHKLIRTGDLKPIRAQQIADELLVDAVPESVAEAAISSLEQIARERSGNVTRTVKIADTTVSVNPLRYSLGSVPTEISGEDAEAIARAHVAARGITDPIQAQAAAIASLLEGEIN